MSLYIALPNNNQQFDYVTAGGMAPCFGEPPLPSTLPIPGADDELFSPSVINGDLSPNCCPTEMSPTFEKRYMREMEKTIEGSRFIAQHVRNKDKFESVSVNRVRERESEREGERYIITSYMFYSLRYSLFVFDSCPFYSRWKRTGNMSPWSSTVYSCGSLRLLV